MKKLVDTKLLDVRYVLIALSTVFAVAVVILLALQINRARQEALQEGFRDARNMANALAQHTRQSIMAVDLVLQGVSAPDTANLLFDPARKPLAHSALKSRSLALQGVYAVFVVDAQGRVFNTSVRPDPNPVDVSDRPEFTVARDSPTNSLFLSAPFLSQNGPGAGKMVVVLSRRLNAADGTFLGVIVASLGLEYFNEFYTHLDIGPQGVIGITRRDGIVISRFPEASRILGRSSVGTPVFEAYKASAGAGEIFSTYVSDGITRITAYRDVPDIDVFVSIGIAQDDMLVGWRRNTLIESGVAVTLILLVIMLAVAASRLLASREVERERSTAGFSRLAAASADIAAIHTGAGLADGIRRMVRELIPGGEAEVRFAVERSGAMSAPLAGERQITVPLKAKGGRVLGAIHVTRPDGPPMTRQDAAVLAQLALIGTVALENVELLAESHRLAEQAERARHEEAEARRTIETVFATMSEGIYTLDSSHRFTFLNDNAVTMLRRRRDQLQGRIVWDVYPHMRESALRHKIEEVFSTQMAAEFELEYETPEGPLWMYIRAFPLNRDAITVYIRDITQRVETENKLRQAQKMEAIGQLTGGVAHDFNNLLTVVLGNVDILVEELTAHPTLQKIAEGARDAALRGATLVARLLAFARRQALAPRPVDVNALTKGLDDLLRRTIGNSIAVKTIRAENLWKASLDPAQMENALLNLALNARDAMPDGGVLTIETSNAHLEEGYADDAPVAPGEYVMVAVSDTGTGMAPEVIARAFDPFFTTKPIGAGSGLGLSMVYGFVRQSGGYVRIYSEVGQGTAIKMYLPRAMEASVSELAAPVLTDIPGGKETLLLVEDDELVREHLTAMLKGLGYTILPCATGDEAIALIKNGTPVDMLLTDIILAGGMNGHGVAKEIKALRPSLPVLYMSGYTENTILSDGRLEPGIHFLGKPFRRQEVAKKLRDVLTGVKAPA